MSFPPSILNLTLPEFSAETAAIGEKEFRARQIFDAVFKRGASDFKEISAIPSALRGKLSEKYSVFTSTVEERVSDEAGNAKFLVRLADGNYVECVLMAEAGRPVVCLSTQVGCPVGCVFCASGSGGFIRNLSTGEIVEEYLHALKHLGPKGGIRGAMYMGMGEPFLNFDAVVRSVEILNAPWGGGIGARHITISTAGVLTGIRRIADFPLQVRLAVSLHSADDAVRRQLVAHPPSGVAELLDAVRVYCKKTRRRPTFEYVLVSGKNDSDEDAEHLARSISDMRPFVNLISMNPVKTSGLKPPGRGRAEGFAKVLESRGIETEIRNSKGASIGAGCGQLAANRRAGPG
jgi:23S rRNA (adenine2503-C2)-methyltransferase